MSEPVSDPVADWTGRLAPIPAGARNMMTVDVEDYFQVEAFAGRINRADWASYDCRVERNTNRILELFAESGAKATFFTLGWIAERYPALIRRIADHGHEIASHGMAHHRADAFGYDRLLADLKESRALLEDVSGQSVKGYRAASFSVTRKNLWALDAIAEAGYRYSSSIYPVHHDLYGIPGAPRRAFRPFETSDFLEIPVTSFPVGKRLNLPAGGGGYFRLLPYWWSRFQLRTVAKNDPCMFYFHPWEIDPEQPAIAGISLKTRVRHYTNLKRMHGRLQQVLRDFAWTRVDAVYPLA